MRVRGKGAHRRLDHLRPFEPVSLHAEIAVRLPARPWLAALARPDRRAAVAVDHAELPTIHARVVLA